MATALWTFETDTTTGFEASVDVNLGLSIQPQGDGSGADVVPCPTVPGHSGKGRLMVAYGRYNAFQTNKETALAYTAGNPITLTFRWRPLLEYDFPGPPTSMFGFNLLGYNLAGTVGLFAIDVDFFNTTTAGQYSLSVGTPGVTTVGTFDMSLRDWHEFEMSYDGVGTLSFSVDGTPIGTKAYVVATAARGRVIFTPQSGSTKAEIGVLDTVELTIS
jgi:hypothetical protein